MTKTLRRMAPLAAALAMTMAAAACGGSNNGTEPNGTAGGALSGSVVVDGSSTVAPLSKAAADIFREQQSGVQVSVGTSGTGGGFAFALTGFTGAKCNPPPILAGTFFCTTGVSPVILFRVPGRHGRDARGTAVRSPISPLTSDF